jgi:hypothetical protein
MDEERNSQELESERLEKLYRKASDPVLRTHLLMIWRRSLGDSIREVAEMVGYSKKWTTEIAGRYERGGVEALGDRRHSNPGARRRGLYSTRPNERSFGRHSWGRRQLRWAGGCGAGRRWRVG